MKLSVSRLVETSKLLNTKAGKDLGELVIYVADLAEDMISALRNGLTLDENENGKSLTVSLTHGTAQVINTDQKRPVEVRVRRVFSSTYGFDGLIWYVNDAGQTVVKINFTGAPTTALDVTLAILFA